MRFIIRRRGWTLRAGTALHPGRRRSTQSCDHAGPDSGRCGTRRGRGPRSGSRHAAGRCGGIRQHRSGARVDRLRCARGVPGYQVPLYSPLGEAVTNGRVDMLELLRASGAHLSDPRSPEGASVLLGLAVQSDHPDVMRYLIGKGVPLRDTSPKCLRSVPSHARGGAWRQGGGSPGSCSKLEPARTSARGNSLWNLALKNNDLAVLKDALEGGSKPEPADPRWRQHASPGSEGGERRGGGAVDRRAARVDDQRSVLMRVPMVRLNAKSARAACGISRETAVRG